MRKISMSLVVLAVLGALFAPGVSQSAAVPAGSACALVLTPLDTDPAGYYCSTSFSNYPVLRWNIVGDAAWTADVISQDYGNTVYSASSRGGHSSSGKLDMRTGSYAGYCGRYPCRVRLHIIPLGPAVLGTVSLLPR